MDGTQSLSMDNTAHQARFAWAVSAGHQYVSNADPTEARQSLTVMEQLKGEPAVLSHSELS